MNPNDVNDDSMSLDGAEIELTSREVASDPTLTVM